MFSVDSFSLTCLYPMGDSTLKRVCFVAGVTIIDSGHPQNKSMPTIRTFLLLSGASFFKG